MKREIIITGKTVEDAMLDARVKHGSEGELSFEILEMPKKGFLGLGGTPAKIKVIIDDGASDIDISAIIDEVTDKKPEPKVEVKPEPKNANAEKPAPKKEQPAPKKEAPKAEKKPEPKAEAPKAEVKPAPKAEAPKAEKKSEPKAEAPKAAIVTPDAPLTKAAAEESKKDKYEPVSDVEMQFAVEFVETVLRDLEIEATATPVKDADGDYVGINIDGENAGTLIGHHGETLDAIQYLANLSASRRSPTPNREFLKITVDIENYREKREETLRSLARRMAAKAVKYKRNFVLEPMNPYERRIIHSEIQGIENVDTHSVGTDENRKVIVTYEGADKSDRNRSRNNRRRSRSNYNAGPAKAEMDPMSPMSYGDPAGADDID